MDDRTRAGGFVGSLEEPSMGALVQAALKESSELVRVEFELAKLEAQKQLHDTAKAAVGFMFSAFLGMMALVLLVVALVIALGGTSGAAFGVAIGAMVLAGSLALASRTWLPQRPLQNSRRHVRDDLKQLRQHVA